MINSLISTVSGHFVPKNCTPTLSHELKTTQFPVLLLFGLDNILSILRGPNLATLADTSRFFTFFNYLVTGSIICSCFFCSFKFKVGFSNLHYGLSCLDFFRNSGPFHHKSALANSSTVRPLVPRSAEFTSVGT